MSNILEIIWHFLSDILFEYSRIFRWCVLIVFVGAVVYYFYKV